MSDNRQRIRTAVLTFISILCAALAILSVPGGEPGWAAVLVVVAAFTAWAAFGFPRLDPSAD